MHVINFLNNFEICMLLRHFVIVLPLSFIILNQRATIICMSDISPFSCIIFFKYLYANKAFHNFLFFNQRTIICMSDMSPFSWILKCIHGIWSYDIRCWCWIRLANVSQPRGAWWGPEMCAMHIKFISPVIL